MKKADHSEEISSLKQMEDRYIHLCIKLSLLREEQESVKKEAVALLKRIRAARKPLPLFDKL
jgi:hypothetical protein